MTKMNLENWYSECPLHVDFWKSLSIQFSLVSASLLLWMHQGCSMGRFQMENLQNCQCQASSVMCVLPVSARLHTPGTAGLCLGERRRFGALQERCRLASLGVLKLSEEHMHAEVWDCTNVWWRFLHCLETHIHAHLSSALCSLCVLPFLREVFLSSSSSYWNAALRPQAWHPTPGVTVSIGYSTLGTWLYTDPNIHNNLNRINQMHKHTYTGSLGGVAKQGGCLEGWSYCPGGSAFCPKKEKLGL